MTLSQEQIADLRSLAALAGEATMAVFASVIDEKSTVDVQKKGDKSPVTEADFASHEILVRGLPDILDIPVLSEESNMPGFAERRRWERYWLIDPLDGTKEFISGSDEFAICIALMQHNKPVFGMVSAPAQNAFWWGGEQHPAAKQKQGETQAIRVRKVQNPVTMVTSRRHGNDTMHIFEQCIRKTWPDVEHCMLGSAIKMCGIAEGIADIYPRLGPTGEWDTAAAQAVVEAAGGRMVRKDLKPLEYNKEELINPDFFAIGDSLDVWAPTIRDFVATLSR